MNRSINYRSSAASAQEVEVTLGKRRAVVLLSGGLDSATTAAIASSEGFELFALSFDYGQRHRHELKAARAVAEWLEVKEHKVAVLDLRIFGGSALTSSVSVPKGRSAEDMKTGIPITYVPARNTIFLSYAIAWAEVLGAQDLFLGVNSVDYSGYPDCRPEYLEAFQNMANLATKVGVEGGRQLRIHAPLSALTKADIIRRGMELGVLYAKTLSCYDPSEAGEACGECDSCQIRLAGFTAAGYSDPAPYQHKEVA